MKELTITKQDAGQRFDKYLKRIFPNMGTSFLYKMLRKKNITLNGKKATGQEMIRTGDLIRCFFADETFDKFTGSTLGQNQLQAEQLAEYQNAYQKLNGIQILYEDENILLLNKPAGILSQKAKPTDRSLNEWMLGYLLDSGAVTADSLLRFKPSVCNRLDRNTSGLIICGKSLLGSREMSRILKDRSLHKYYRTYVHGELMGEKTAEAYHFKDTKTNQAKILFSKPDRAEDSYDKIITAYRSLEIHNHYSYLEIELITGKTHQIRAHLAAYGYPIVGDTKYTVLAEQKIQKSVHNRMQVVPAKAITPDFPKYQLLHAYRILFPKMDGEFSCLSEKEFICEEPALFHHFRQKYFL